ncbi:uncharacterized protein N7484_003452 [Penicillium longicatenatum]|uniref:uncharacterized protein n=1 Tax=Penicillium longicatenatum TaxID=1561947 RepID=UPI002547F600|nr:uncharacterized protein N7484_003452 [Penicillium longicatenatum]KAJ5649729.1 hypothetical protein N7484_003452 [Penicillium longicatenatum]
MKPTVRSPLPYGNACATCARAKCRCVPRSGGGRCERCHRLDKECRVPQGRRKTQPQTLSRSVQLERKMNGLMLLLTSSSGSRTDLPTPVHGQAEAQGMGQTEVESDSEDEETLASEEESLHTFRTQRLQFLPLIHIPATTTVRDLKRQSPFLWRCITAVESKHTARQAALCVTIRELAGKRLLVDCDKSLDLLQGVLVYLAWVTFHSQPQKSSLCIYSQMAIGLIFELGLNKPAPPDLSMTVSNSNAVGHMPGLKASISTLRTMNERRAVLSCFVLTSIIAQFLGRMDPLRWTPHMKECLDILVHSEESSGDGVLVQFTRTRLLADQIFQGPWSEGLYGLNAAQTLAAFHLKALQSRLETIKAEIPIQLADNKPILFHLYDTELSLYEVALVKPLADEEFSPQRLDHLCTCLHVVKQFFDLFFTIPPAGYTSLALPYLTQVSHCLVTLFRLSTLDYPGWDKSAVKGVVDILVIAEQIATRMSQVADAVGMRSEGAYGDPFSKLGMMMQKLRSEWAVRLPEFPEVVADQSSGEPFLSSMEMGDLDSFMNWSEMAWLTEGRHHAANMSEDRQPRLLKSEPTPWDHEIDAENPNESDEYEPQWVEGRALVMVIAGITLVVFLMLLDMSIVSTAIPKITNQFNSLNDVAWYGSAYTISSAALQPLTGKFYTYFSSKWTFLSFFSIFEVGSLICGVANSSKMLIVGRAIAGMGSSGMLNGALNILAGAVPIKKRPAMIGIIMGVGQLGLVGGPLVGGAFTTHSTWRWCFYMNLPIGALVGALLLFTRIPDQKPKQPARENLRSVFLQKFDLIGFVLFAPASIMLLLALQYGGNGYSWNSATVIGLFCGSVANFVVFALWERHMGIEAMIPGHLVCDQIVLSSSLLSIMTFGLTMTLSYYLPIYFQSVRGKSAWVSGVNLLPNILCQLVMAVASGVLTSKLGYYLPWGVLGAILDAVGNGLLSTLSPTTSVPPWAGYESLVGFGRGAISQVPMIAIQNAVKGDDVSTAMAMMTCAQTFGGSIFLAVAEVIFSQGLRTNIPEYAPSVNAEAVIQAGATGFRQVVSAQDLPAVLVAYSKSIDQVFYLNTALSCAQFVFAWGVGWRSVKKGKEAKEKDENQLVAEQA